MATFDLKIVRREERLTKRGHGQIMRRVNRNVANWHRKVNAPKHTSGAPETKPGGGYQFVSRSAGYRKWKRRKVGHNIPNRLTGRLNTEIAYRSKITATQYLWRFQAKSYFPLTADRKRELEIVSPREQREAGKLTGHIYGRLARNPRYWTRKTRRLAG